MLTNNPIKIVELFIDNLLSGKITLEYYRILENGGNEEYINNIYKMVKGWISLHNKKILNDFDDNEYMILSDYLYDVYIEGRINGTIKGELVDETSNRICQLENELQETKDKNNSLKTDNIRLAQELYQYRHMIDVYEKPFINNKDDD